MRTQKISFFSKGNKIIGEMNLSVNQGKKLPTIILFHGLTNTRNDCPLIVQTAKTLVENGFNSFRFDFFGSGESDGEMKDKTLDILLQNAKDAVEFISNHKLVDKNKIGLWGRSIGGTIGCLIPPNKKIKARVLASPGVFLENSFENKFKGLQEKEKKLEKIGKKLPGTGSYKGKFELKKSWFTSLKGTDKKIIRNLNKLKNILVLGTSYDQKVTINNVCQIINFVKEPKRIWIYPCDHDYAGFEKEAIRETTDWFKKFL